jgi:hypothetical protein
MPGALGIWVLVPVSPGLVSAGSCLERRLVCAGQAGLLAIVMMAGAMRVAVSFALA